MTPEIAQIHSHNILLGAYLVIGLVIACYNAYVYSKEEHFPLEGPIFAVIWACWPLAIFVYIVNEIPKLIHKLTDY